MTKIGTVIAGRYEILKEIGHGGMSTVYLANDTHMNRNWAVKEVAKEGLGQNDKAVSNSPVAEAHWLYEEVIKGFDVEHEARYQMDPNGDTWCNVYVADVTSAMNAPIPHYCDPSTGAPMSKADSGGTWLNANAMQSWLSNHGSNYGWISCTREEAIDYANSGRPTVATGVGHIAMVAPQHEGEDGVMLAQAGGEVSSYISINQCWTRHDQNELQYFYHL